MDTETTGLVPGVHQVWEVALVTDDGRKYSWLVYDVKLGNADPQALEIGRFWERWDGAGANDKYPASRVARQVSRLTAERAVVGINPAFDVPFLDELLRRHNRPHGWHYQVIDVKAMAAGYLHGRSSGYTPEARKKHIGPAGALPWRSDDLSRACGVKPPAADERHTALGDARWAWRWYRQLTGAADVPTTVGDGEVGA